MEKFAVFPKPEDCGAEFGTEGTIAGFMESQGVGPYFQWSLRYSMLYRRMLVLLDRMGVEGRVEARAAGAPAGGPPENAPVGAAPMSSWQDIDASLAEYCAAKGVAVPSGVEDAIDLHLAALKDWLDELEARIGKAPDKAKGAEKR